MMEILFFLIPLSLICSTLGLLFFIWAVNGGQLDDMEHQADLFKKIVLIDGEK